LLNPKIIKNFLAKEFFNFVSCLLGLKGADTFKSDLLEHHEKNYNRDGVNGPGVTRFDRKILMY